MNARALASVAFVLFACGGAEAPKTVAGAGRPTCATHGDCVITTFSGCCSCCEVAPHAMLRSELHRQEGSCAGADCAPCSPDIECKKHDPIDAFNAICREGTCITEPKKEDS